MKSKFVLSLLFAGSLLAGNLPAAEPTSPATPAPAKKSGAAQPAPVPATEPAAKADVAATAVKAEAPKPESRAAPAPSAATPGPSPAGVQKMAADFGEKSQDLLVKNKALRDRLSAAKTQEEQQKIIAELRDEARKRRERQQEIARNIREQLQNNRRNDSGVGIAVGP